MGKGRLEAFSDGVIAVIITIMVLELKVPHGTSVASIAPLLPAFLTYALSFVFVGIYWNNHHHLFHTVEHVNGAALWANLHLLFWLSLVPFVTGWMSENDLAPAPVALYGCVLLMTAIAYRILTRVLIKRHGARSTLAQALGRDRKTTASLAMYAAGMLASGWSVWVACGVYVLVAALWLIPDSRFEPLSQTRRAPS